MQVGVRTTDQVTKLLFYLHLGHLSMMKFAGINPKCIEPYYLEGGGDG